MEGARLPAAGVREFSSVALSLCVRTWASDPSSLSFPGYEIRMGEGGSLPDS